nr:hypothetical protein [Acetobacter persici]
MPVRIRKTSKTLLGYLVAFVVLSAFYMSLAATLPLNSDSVSAVLEAQDILHGNILLRGWDLSTEPYYVTEILPYVVAAGLAGWHLSFYYLVPAMLLAPWCCWRSGCVGCWLRQVRGFGWYWWRPRPRLGCRCCLSPASISARILVCWRAGC